MITIGDKKYPFQVGTFLHEKYVEELTDGSLTELYQTMQSKPASVSLFVYAGIKAGYRADKQDCLLTLDDLEWEINEAGLDDLVTQITKVQPREKKTVNTSTS